MKLSELLKELDTVYVKGSAEKEVSSIEYDSRKVKEGSVFVCIEGFKADGHAFIPSAIENGAVVIVTSKESKISENITNICVEDTRYALAVLASAFYGQPSQKINLIGVTGTKGKTTITHMIKEIYELNNQKTGLIGTIANKIGDRVLTAQRTTPEAVDLQSMFNDMLEEKVNNAVMEVSSQGLKLHRVSCCDFDMGVFTNLSLDHIGPNEHESFEDYFNSKAKLFNMCKKALINIDDEYGRKIIEKSNAYIHTYGIDNEADFSASDIKYSPQYVEFTLSSKIANGRIRVNIPGRFSIYNALAATGACLINGIPFDLIKSSLKKINVPGRVEIVHSGKEFTVIVDYAHTPDSLENVLKTVKSYTPGKLICVFGCGGDRDKSKRPLMGKISGEISDYSVITSDNPRTEDENVIISDIEEGIKGTNSEYIIIVDRYQAIKHAIVNAKQGDVIILAGKGHETYQIFRDKTIHFDEKEVVKEILSEIGRE